MSKSKRKLSFKPSNQLITRREFAAMHFGKEEYDSDQFYVKLANGINQLLLANFKGDKYITPFYTRKASLMLAAYVEDIVASNGVFTAFMLLHKEKFGRLLPFYDLDSAPTFSPDMPSLSAIKFLLWYVLNDANPDTILNPMNEGIEEFAHFIGLTIMESIKNAPDTPMRPEIKPESECGVPEIFQIRELCLWLVTECYLTKVDNIEKLSNDTYDFLHDIFKKTGNIEVDQIEYGVYSYLPYNVLVGPLALPAYKWLAAIISVEPEPYEKKILNKLQSFESQSFDFYRYAKIAKKSAQLISVDGKVLKLSADTMPNGEMPNYIKVGDTAFMSLVKYGNSWNLSGLSLMSLDAEVFDQIKSGLEKKSEQKRLAYEYNLKKFKNKRIGVVANYDEYLSMVDEIKDLPCQNDSNIDIEDLNHVDNLLFFLNSTGSVSLVPDVGMLIKIRGNKFYDKESAELYGVGLILGDILEDDDELKKYVIDNNLIPDAMLVSTVSKKAGRELFQKNMPFLYDYVHRDSLQTYKSKFLD